MTLYANTHCSVVAGGAVTQTGQFRDLIAPTSTLSGGTDDTYAKTRWGYILIPVTHQARRTNCQPSARHTIPVTIRSM
jgi:hypothetical protein